MTHQGNTSQDTSHDAANATRQGPAQDGRELESKHPAQQKRDDGAVAPLPHETDQSPASQQEDEPREVGEQAHEDLERGLQDTDRRGGADGCTWSTKHLLRRMGARC
ncbi:hypothetical protein [Caballeronia sp. dw_19]|uniref:hypothetical protein n=1 Tax=Caballeronia sp. dw_19 TaxID=2719791 RepID=UPI002104E7E5|nr:hypothetical protein [Caballeronia sp. dw_19]